MTETRAAMQARVADLTAALAAAEAGHDEELGAYEQRLADADQALQAMQERLAERTQALEARLAQTRASGATADTIRAFYGRVAELGARFTAQGIQDRPVASNAIAEGRQQNRRVEVYLIEPEGDAE